MRLRIAVLLNLALWGCADSTPFHAGDARDDAAADRGLEMDQDVEDAGLGHTASDAGADAEAGSVHDLCVTLAARAGVALHSTNDVSWARLLCDTIDLGRFLTAPAFPYEERLASSYDRASVSEGQNGWYANSDRGMYLRDQGDEHVMMEVDGPGVITRLWSPTPSGRVRIYIDDRDAPAIDVDMRDFLSGKFDAPWGAPLVFSAGEGYSAYFPIPFAHYARVATTTSEALYYQVNFRSYASQVRVESFSNEGLHALAPLVAEIAGVVHDPERLAMGGELQKVVQLHEGSASASVPLGPSVIRELSLKGFTASEAWLRQTRLIITVDGERTVDAPIRDSFGSGQGLTPHVSLASSVSQDELVLRWPMPVQGLLTFAVESNGGSIGELELALRYSPGLPAQARRFHARWTGVETFDTTNPVDWTLLHTHGRGWYVGTLLNVANSSPAWWGEGDEKIFVDGAAQPSHFGTGTEDYFGFGWCSNERFIMPWIGQARADGPVNWGRASMYRWHVPDAIPFNSELRFKLEVWHWVQAPLSAQLSEDAVVYWYAEPTQGDARPILDASAFELAPPASGKPLLPEGKYTCK